MEIQNSLYRLVLLKLQTHVTAAGQTAADSQRRSASDLPDTRSTKNTGVCRNDVAVDYRTRSAAESLNHVPEAPSTKSATKGLNDVPEAAITKSPTDLESVIDVPKAAVTKCPTESLNDVPEAAITKSPTESLNYVPEARSPKSPTESLNDVPEALITKSPTESLNEVPEDPDSKSPTEILNDVPQAPSTNSPTESLKEVPEASHTKCAIESPNHVPEAPDASITTASLNDAPRALLCELKAPLEALMRCADIQRELFQRLISMNLMKPEEVADLSRKKLAFGNNQGEINGLILPCTINPIQTGLGAFEGTPTLKNCNFQSAKAMTTKFGYFSENLSGNILTLVSLVHQL